MSYIDNPGCTVEIRRAQPHAVYGETELGVIIHGGMTWLVACARLVNDRRTPT